MSEKISKEKKEKQTLIPQNGASIHSFEMEKAVIGGILINPQSYFEIAHLLGDKDFYNQHSRRVFQEIKKFFNNKQEPDIATLVDSLSITGFSDAFGFITDCISSCSSSLNLNSYVSRLTDYTTRRKINWIANQLANIAIDAGFQNTDELVGKFQEIVSFDIEPKGFTNNTVSSDEASLSLMVKIQNNTATGIITGFPIFDDVIFGLGGFPRQAISLLLGDSSFGKSGWVIQLCEQIAISGKKALLFGYEQGVESNVSRRVFGATGIDYKKLRSGKLSKSEINTLEAEIISYQGRFSQNGGEFLMNSMDMTLSKVKSEIRKHRPDFVVIDQFKFIKDTVDNGNITQSYIHNMTELKNYAKEFDCHIIAVQPITAEESKKFFEANAKATSGTSSAGNVKNAIPDVNAISWAKELKFIVDVILFIVPAVTNKLNSLMRPASLKMLIWILKDREGDRFLPTYWDYNLKQQWWTDERPPTSSNAQRPSNQTQPPPKQIPQPQSKPIQPQNPGFEFKDIPEPPEEDDE